MEDEVEAFDITDYDIRWGLGAEKRRGLSKNQQLYGIWADEENSDDEGGGSGRGRGFGYNSSGKSKKKSYSSGIRFESGGIQQAGKEKEKTGGAGSGLTGMNEYDSDSNNSSDGESAMPSSSRGRHGGFNSDQMSFAGIRSKGGAKHSLGHHQDFGGWEKFTKGIGSKLLLKMGAEPGKGLGKNLQGICEPIQAEKRKGRGAIGAYGPEFSTKLKQREKEIAAAAALEADGVEGEGSDSKGRKLQGTGWRKSAKGAKDKFNYKTIDEVIDEDKVRAFKHDYDDSHLSQIKVIDMRGPEKKVLTGYHSLSRTKLVKGQQDDEDDMNEGGVGGADGRKKGAKKSSKEGEEFANFNVPELLHNLSLLVEMSEQDVRTASKRGKTLEERVIVLEREAEELGKQIQADDEVIESVQGALALVEHLERRMQDEQKSLSIEEAIAILHKLQSHFPNEYQLYELAALSFPVLIPLFQKLYKNWVPMSDPNLGLNFLLEWRPMLEINPMQGLGSDGSMDPYHRLIWESWMPPFRLLIRNWECRNCEPIIQFIETWIPVLPNWICECIYDQLILVKLQEAVLFWDPLTDTVPIHSWVLPWLPHLGNKLEIIYGPIRQKMAAALTNWHPSDTSAKLILQPWFGVFTQGCVDSFLVKNIIPKLEIALTEFEINPSDQKLDNWNWVMNWKDMISTQHMASLLNRAFFVKWLKVLYNWLTHGSDLEEVARWYRGWKSLLPPKLLLEPSVQENLQHALEMMYEASEAGGSISNPSLKAASNTAATVQSISERIQESVKVASSASVPGGFRELLEKRCEENSILFVPISGRYHEGQQVYRCGNQQIIIQKNVIFIFNILTSAWAPVSLQNLIDNALT